MLVGKGYRAATLSDRRCPVLSVVVGWDVAPMWPQPVWSEVLGQAARSLKSLGATQHQQVPGAPSCAGDQRRAPEGQQVQAEWSAGDDAHAAHHQQQKPANGQQDRNRQVPDRQAWLTYPPRSPQVVIESLSPTTATTRTAIPGRTGGR
jgi:hypothetical protein